MMLDDLNKVLERDTRALKFIVHHFDINGYPPSVREVGKAIDVSSSSTAHEVISRLAERGWISIGQRMARTIRVTEDGMKVARA